jgi:hypothetical protein
MVTIESVGVRSTPVPGGGYVGIDVSKARLDVAHSPSGKAWGFANDDAGRALLAERLGEVRPD